MLFRSIFKTEEGIYRLAAIDQEVGVSYPENYVPFESESRLAAYHEKLQQHSGASYDNFDVKVLEKFLFSFKDPFIRRILGRQSEYAQFTFNTWLKSVRDGILEAQNTARNLEGTTHAVTNALHQKGIEVQQFSPALFKQHIAFLGNFLKVSG